MKKASVLGLLLSLFVLLGVTMDGRAAGVPAATAQFTAAPLPGGGFVYTITLDNTGATTIGTFWNGWLPGENFMAVSPTNIISPAGWVASVTNDGVNDGYAIQWKASSHLLAPAHSLQFSFESTATRAEMDGDSVFHPGTPVETSVSYSGIPFSDAGDDLVVQDGGVTPAPPQNLKYTVLICPTDSSATIPQGVGYATMDVSKKGRVVMAGKLADGESFSVSGATVTGTAGPQFAIEKSLTYPSVTTRGAKGGLAGTLTFVTETGTSDLNGVIAWTKPQQKKGAYPAAIDTSLTFNGSLYTRPARGGSVLPNFDSGTLELTDNGTLSATGTTPLVKTVTLTPANRFVVTDPGADKAKLTATATSGVFKGTFLYPGQKKRTNFAGVLFQDQTAGVGYFLGPDGGGKVVLSQ